MTGKMQLSERGRKVSQMHISTGRGLLRRFAKDDCGATAIEYALIAGLIALVIITGVTAVGTKLSTSFENLKTQMK